MWFILALLIVFFFPSYAVMTKILLFILFKMFYHRVYQVNFVFITAKALDLVIGEVDLRRSVIV